MPQQQLHTQLVPPAAQQQLAQFLLGLIGIALMATVLYGVLWSLFQQPLFLALSGLSFVSGLGIALGRWYALRGAIQTAIVVCVIVMLGATIVFMLAAPALLPIMSLLPVLAIATALPYVERDWLLRLFWFAVGTGVIIAFLGRFNVLAVPMPVQISQIAVPIIMPCVIGAVLWLVLQFHQRLTTALAQNEQAVHALQAAQEQLETQVQMRTADLQRAMKEIEQRADAQATLLEEVQQQRDTIREMSVPVLPVTRNELVVPLVGALDTMRLAQLREQTLAEIERRRAHRLILDVTGVPVVDTFVAQGIVQVVQAARLLGAESVLVGIRPEVAQALVGLGVDLSAIRSYADLASALGRA